MFRAVKFQTSLRLIQFTQPYRLVSRNAGINNLLNISIHNLIQLIQSQINPVIGYTSLWEIVRPDFLRAVAGADLAAACLGLRVLFFLQPDRKIPAAE